MDEKVYREYLRSVQVELDEKEKILLDLIDRMKKRGVKIPDNLPDLNATRLPPIEIAQEVQEPQSPHTHTQTIESEDELQDFTELKEPELNESELMSDTYKRLKEAHEKGVPFIMLPKPRQTPVSTQPKPPTKTPTSDTFHVKTVKHLFLSPAANHYYNNKFMSVINSASPELGLDQWQSKKRPVSPQLSSQAQPSAACASTSASVRTPTVSLFKSPEEPELQYFHELDKHQKLSTVLKSPDSPELSEHLMRLLKMEPKDQ